MKPTHDLDPVDDIDTWGSLQGLDLTDDIFGISCTKGDDESSLSDEYQEFGGFPALRNETGGGTDTSIQDAIDDFKRIYPKKPPTPPPTPVLPGSGDPGRHCGEERDNTCWTCGKRFISTYHCSTRLCPSCYKRWASREARIASEFIKEFRDGYWVSHVVISFPGQPEDIWRLRSRAYKIAKIHGGYGGSCVPHPWRWDELTEAWIHDGYIHYHMICFFGSGGFKTLPAVQREDADRNGGRMRGKYDYVFKVIRQRDAHGGFSYWVDNYRLKKMIYYQLDHCGISDNTLAVTWWGFMHQIPALKATTRRIKDTYTPCPCPHCKSKDTSPGSVIDPREEISDEDRTNGTYDLHYCPIEPRKKIDILDYGDGEWIV